MSPIAWTVGHLLYLHRYLVEEETRQALLRARQRQLSQHRRECGDTWVPQDESPTH